MKQKSVKDPEKKQSISYELRYQKRVEVVKAIQREEEPKVVARVFNIPNSTIYDWIARYRHGGWHALREGYRSGRPRKVNGKVLKWLYNAITKGNPNQYKLPGHLHHNLYRTNHKYRRLSYPKS